MENKKTILNTNENTNKKANAKNEYFKTLKNSNMINYASYNKNKQLKKITTDFIFAIIDEKSNQKDEKTARMVRISNENATHFKNEILNDFASKLFYNQLKNIDFSNFNIKKIIATALLNNFKTKATKIDRRQNWSIDNTTFETIASNYKFLCDVCHRLAVYIDNQNKLAK